MKPFRVVAIFRQRGGFLDTYFAYVSLAEAQRFLGTVGQVTGVEIEVDSFDQATPVAAALRQTFSYPFAVRSFV